MQDLIQKHFGYGHYAQHAARIRLDYTSLIQLPSANSVLFFQRRPGSHCAKPTQIWSGWSGQVLGKCILSGSKLVCKNHWAQFAVSGRMQLAYYWFPTFRLGCILPQMAQIILCKTSPDPTGFWWTTSSFDKMDPVWKQAGVQESSSLLLVNASKLIWTGCRSDLACLLGVYQHL